ncbi:MAG: glucose-1-phosphate cytidylyltransferase [Candidatus Eisenbacteria bacterium]
MQTVILAGGLGTRLSEETTARPKPMVEIGDRPILHHIMELYDAHGMREFVVALGYLGHMIKRYFVDWTTLSGDLTIDARQSSVDRHRAVDREWSLQLIETGALTDTGGRLKRLAPHLRRETFMLTYGDGLSDVDLTALLAFHRRHGRLATITGVHPPARFGELELDGDRVVRFDEKPQVKQGWINGGFMVLEPGVLDRIEGDATVLERDVLTRLAAEGQLMVYRHPGFWQCMDTLRDVRMLSALAEGGSPPWRRRS